VRSDEAKQLEAMQLIVLTVRSNIRHLLLNLRIFSLLGTGLMI